ncbi:MAG: lysophospholipid acyltransferase family protein [Gammaproteobacteria bacterium]
MRYLRSFLFNTLLFISTPFYTAAAFLFCWLSYDKRYPFLIAWQRSMIWLAEKICGIRYEVKGLENLPNEPCIIASNHQSAWETLAFCVIFPNICFVLKKELLYLPFFGWALWLWQPIAIDRKQKSGVLEQVIRQGSERLALGRSVIIFPEGKRMPADQPGQVRSGAAALARATGAPLVPVSHNAGKFWPRRGWLKYPGLITVHIGKAIYPENHEYEQNKLHCKLVSTITKQIKILQHKNP